jgi:hypothetical protein
VIVEADTTPASIAEHPFTSFMSVHLAWGRCTICGLAAAAHTNAIVFYEPPAELPYRCPDCVIRSEATHKIVPCFHREGAYP